MLTSRPGTGSVDAMEYVDSDGIQQFIGECELRYELSRVAHGVGCRVLRRVYHRVWDLVVRVNDRVRGSLRSRS